jgi:hypothetical protein
VQGTFIRGGIYNIKQEETICSDMKMVSFKNIHSILKLNLREFSQNIFGKMVKFCHRKNHWTRVDIS